MNRSENLAARLEAGASALAAFAASLNDSQWNTPLPKDGRKVGVVVHHVASVYPLEVQFAAMLASGQSVSGITWDAVAAMNRDHSRDNAAVTKLETLDLLARNSAAAAAAIRAMTDEQLDASGPVALYGGAPLTCQFLLEDHAIRHSYHHLAGIQSALNR